MGLFCKKWLFWRSLGNLVGIRHFDVSSATKWTPFANWKVPCWRFEVHNCLALRCPRKFSIRGGWTSYSKPWQPSLSKMATLFVVDGGLKCPLFTMLFKGAEMIFTVLESMILLFFTKTRSYEKINRTKKTISPHFLYYYYFL